MDWLTGVIMRLNPALEKLTPYKAGPSLTEIRENYGVDRIVEMAANEVPWGPFPEVVEALKSELAKLNRYPDGACTELRSLLASQLGVGARQLCFGNGSCELLMLLGQALVTCNQHVVFPHPSFVMYRSIVMANSGSFTAVPLKGLEHDLEAMLAAIREDTSLVIVCNPNNPTGTYIEPATLRSFLERVPSQTVVALDEAYGEFVTSPAREDTAGWVNDFPNLVILHTFSKIYGLAGLRIGYAIADTALIEELDKIRQPFNVDSLAQAAAMESLRHPQRVAERSETIDRERRRLEALLAHLGIRCHPGEANFLLVDVTAMGIPGPEVGQALLAKGILTRSGYAMDCAGWIRVTIGEAAEGDLFVSAMKELRDSKAHHGAKSEDSALDARSLSPES
jgi:histidinol-phosphate aminotransferase